MRALEIVLLIALPCLSASSVIQEHFANVPIKEILEAMARTCERKTGATKDDMKLLRDYDNMSTTRESKCMVACLADFFGATNGADDSYDKINLDLYFTFAFKPEERSAASAIWDTCHAKEPHNLDHCERVFNIMKCYFRGVRAAKLTPIPFWNVY